MADQSLAFDGVDARFRALALTQGLIVFRCSPDGQLLNAPGWEDVTGQTRDEYLSVDGWAQVIHPDDMPKLLAERSLGLREGRPFAHEFRIRARDGSWRWMASQCAPVRGPHGSIAEWVGSIRDVHDQRVSESQLREGKALLRLMVENSAVGMALFDTDMRYITHTQRYVRDSLGIDHADLTGRSHYDVFPTIPDHLRAVHSRVLAGEELSAADEPVPRADGREMWIDWLMKPWRTDDGGIGGAILFCEDVTARHLEQRRAREREEQLRLGQQVAGFGTFHRDFATNRYHFSREVYDIYGLEEGTEITGALLVSLFHPDDSERIRDAAIASQEGPPGQMAIEHRIIRPDGEERWVSVNVQVFFEGEGDNFRAHHSIGAIKDITDRKQAELQLRETAERLRIGQAAGGFGTIDREEPDGAIELSPEARDILGLDADQPVDNEALLGLVHPADREALLAEVERVVKSGDGNFRYEHRIIRPDGTERWIATHLRYTFAGEGSERRAVRSIGALQDITERKRSEEDLRASEARFRGLTQSLPALIFVTDPAGHNTYTNAQFQDYAGRSAVNLLGDRWLEILHPDDRARAAQTWQASWRDGKPYQAEYRFRRADGAYRWHLVRGNPVHNDDGEIAQWVGTCTDVQDLREARQALADANSALEERIGEAVAEREAAQAQLFESQKLETLGQLTGGVAHDFNNLLTPIVGGLDFIHNRVRDDPRLERIVSGALQSAERARTLVQRLLAFARRQTLKPQPVDPAALIGSLSDLMTHSLGDDIRVEIAVASDLPPVLADPNQLELALLNLAINARDSMNSGGSMTISAVADDGTGVPSLAPGRYVRFTVRDTGTGMDRETLSRAVEPFFTTKAVGRGTGLGLSMVHGLALQSGGAFRLSSEPNQGTAADLWLPVSDRPAVPAIREIGQAPQAPRRATLLLVEDEELVRASMADGLQDLGYEVHAAASGSEALELLSGGLTPDLMITDHLMPGMSGARLIELARAIRPDMPVLMVTGYASLEPGQVEGLELLMKPFRHAELARRVADLIARRPDISVRVAQSVG